MPMPRILLIDDDADEQLLFGEILCELPLPRNVRLDFCTSGKEALSTFKDACPPPYDLVLLDVNMPQINGLELLQSIQGSIKSFAVEVLGFSTSRDRIVKQKFLDSGAADFFTKPSEAADYEHIVESFGLRAIANYCRRKNIAQ